ncbi:MAG: collagen-binding domain-containing protein, partial [Mycobacterium sp.]
SMMRSIMTAGFGLCLALLLAATPARAALTAAELSLDEAVLNQFNVVTFGNYTANSETEGLVAVGGNFTGSGRNICFNGCAGATTSAALGATYGALTVWGNMSGGATVEQGNAAIQGNNTAASTLNMQGNGGVSIAGTNSGTIENPTFIRTSAATAGATMNLRNNVPITTGLPAATAFPYGATMPFQAALTDLATSIAADAAATNAQTLGKYVQNGPTGITATAANGDYGGMTYGFITTTVADLESDQNFSGIDTNGLDAVFVVVTGQSTGPLPTLNTNDSNVIWDFVDATSLTFSGSWYGQILAPNATVTNNGDLNGTVIAKAIVQNAEIHQYDNGGDVLPLNVLSGLPTTTIGTSQGGGTSVDEPSTIAVLLVGVLGLVVLRRKMARA